MPPVTRGALIEHGIAGAALQGEDMTPAAATSVPCPILARRQDDASTLPPEAVVRGGQADAEAPVPEARAGPVVVHPPLAWAVAHDLGRGHEELVPAARPAAGQHLAPAGPAAVRRAEGHSRALLHAKEGPGAELERLPAAAKVVEPVAHDAAHPHQGGVEVLGVVARRQHRATRQRAVGSGPRDAVLAARQANGAHRELHHVRVGLGAAAVVEHRPGAPFSRGRLHPDAAE
mmetsp:Transcript_36509/g.101341  ORF Transcript_36509/g.101341 Transcript_36509/m.101341 type:complete len:232 (-) Transcript_36509:79-774(-)